MADLDHSRRRIVTLRPGEMSLHRVCLVHGSPPNRWNDRRIGFAIRYIPAGLVQLAGEDSATLVRGEDRHHHFMSEPRPTRTSTRNSWRFTAPSPSAMPGSSIAAPKSPATTSRRRWRSAAEPGKAHTWACGFMYALGQLNFLSDKATQAYMAMTDVCVAFGVGQSTASGKGARRVSISKKVIHVP